MDKINCTKKAFYIKEFKLTQDHNGKTYIAKNQEEDEYVDDLLKD